jgi:hypothetical protein
MLHSSQLGCTVEHATQLPALKKYPGEHPRQTVTMPLREQLLQPGEEAAQASQFWEALLRK